MNKWKKFLSNFTEAPPGISAQRKGLGRWFEIIEIHPMKLFWTNLLTFAFLIPCTAAAFFMIHLWDWLSLLSVWICWGIAGPAVTALHYICIKISRGSPVWVWRDYRDCMKREWKKAIPLSLIIGALWLMLIWIFRASYVADGTINIGKNAFLLVYGFLLTGFSVFSYQQLAMVDVPLRGVLRNGILLIFAGKGRSFATVLCAYIVIALCLYYYSISYFLLLIGVYAVTVLTVNFIFAPVFNDLFPSEE